MNEKQELSTVYRSVSKPGRYTGGEYNQILKDKASVSVRFAFCFPDTYEIGMSNLGVRILYECLNRVPYIWCERVYAPWLDMMAKMETHGIPLSAMESGDKVGKDNVIVVNDAVGKGAVGHIANVEDILDVNFFAKPCGNGLFIFCEKVCRALTDDAKAEKGDFYHGNTPNFVKSF